jgi:hypothetical protein
MIGSENLNKVFLTRIYLSIVIQDISSGLWFHATGVNTNILVGFFTYKIATFAQAIQNSIPAVGNREV